MTILTTLLGFTAALLVVAGMLAVCLRAPKIFVLGFIAVLFLFSSSTWGQLQVENTIYSRGVGVFYFSLLNLALLVAGVAALLRKLASPHNPHLQAPMGGLFLAFLFMLCAHVLLGVMSGIDVLDTLANNGIINILNMWIFMYLVVMAFRGEKDTNALLLTILGLAALRALFGIVRYVWFGGDSANPYRNFESLDIKIFFFDISDNFIAALAAFCAAWLLSSPEVRLSLAKRLALYAFLALEIAAVALSFRRSSLLGLGLMFLLLLYWLPTRRKLKFMLLALALLWLAAVALFQQRLQYSDDSNILTALVYDIAGGDNSDGNRFYELHAAAQSLQGHWLFGLGSWGSYEGDRELLSYHFGKLDFVHSGLGHIVLKSGLAGLLLFCGLLLAYTVFYFRHRRHFHGNARLIADAGFAGFLFWIPSLLVGTPIIEFRSMLLIGLTLAMPFIAAGLEKYRMRGHVIA